MARHLPSLGLLIVLIAAGLFVFLSIRSSLELQSTLPPDFVQLDPKWDARRRQSEQRLALAYWQCAVRTVQRRIPFGTELPGDPPAYFKIDPKDFSGPEADSRTARLRYWKKIQEVWPRPSLWRRNYTWDMSWIPRLISRLFTGS